MNTAQIFILGLAFGFVIGFFMIVNILAKKEEELLLSYKNLVDTLNLRYAKLRIVLDFLKQHMSEFSSEIDDLSNICEEAINSNNNIENVIEKLKLENTINYKLEEIKSNMSSYDTIAGDFTLKDAITDIATVEAQVGKAISYYNQLNLNYKLITESFPASLVANICGKNKNYIPFTVAEVQEFDDSYIDENDI